MSGPATALVTRPAREAARWVQALRDRGLSAEALPLIEIAPVASTEALRTRAAAVRGLRALMFVSANAVDGWFDATGAAWPVPGPRAWAPGPGTGEALRRRGVPADCIDLPAPGAPFDSEALWAQVHPQVRAGDRVLIVRGGDASGQPAGREWLADRLAASGAVVDTVVAYLRRVPAWGEAERRLARTPAAWWLFSSSEAIRNLALLCPGQDWSGARAACTHARIARAARDAGFGRVESVPPALESVASFLQSAT